MLSIFLHTITYIFLKRIKICLSADNPEKLELFSLRIVQKVQEKLKKSQKMNGKLKNRKLSDIS